VTFVTLGQVKFLHSVWKRCTLGHWRRQNASQLCSRRSLKASPRPGRSPASRLTETKKAPTCARPGGCQLDGLARCVVKSKRSTQTPATAARYVRNGTLVRDAGSGCDGGHGRPVVADLNGECRWWQRNQATARIKRRPFAAGPPGRP